MLMLFRVKFPPKPFTEIRRVLAHTFEIVEVFGRDVFQDLPHPAHRYLVEVVAYAGTVQLCAEEAHKLSSLGDAHFYFRALEM